MGSVMEMGMAMATKVLRMEAKLGMVKMIEGDGHDVGDGHEFMVMVFQVELSQQRIRRVTNQMWNLQRKLSSMKDKSERIAKSLGPQKM